MRWLVTGAGGTLGHDVVRVLEGAGEEVLAPPRSLLDVTRPDAVDAFVRGRRPDVVVNCAAYTDVDGAEAEPERAREVNAAAPGHLARACARGSARLVHISTDYVFSGRGRSTPYAEDCPTDPCSVYALTKRDGEDAVLGTLPDRSVVLRTSWLYGAHGRSFVGTMAGRAARGLSSEVVDTQVGQPTWSRDLAERVLWAGRRADAVGVLHAVNGGRTTWFGLARAVYALAGADPALVSPCPDDRFPRAADRPSYSVLGGDRWADWGAAPLRDWSEALAEALREMAPRP